MSDDSAARILLRPYGEDALAWPEGRILFLNARRADDLPAALHSGIDAIQPDRAHALHLSTTGLTSRPAPGDATEHAAVWILVARQHRDNADMLRHALAACADGGTLVIAGSKSSGAERILKTMRQAGLIDGKMSKHHAVVFWTRIDGLRRTALAAVADALSPADPTGIAGAFHGGDMDAGTAFLLANLPDDLFGAVADFGAGTGLIAEALARRFPKLAFLDLYESHWGALEAARDRMGNGGSIALGYHWQDVILEPVKRRYDRIVTNPPFHDALGHTDPGLGIRFLQAALGALKPRGVLLAVANRDLPYEQPLRTAGAEVECLAADARFKLLAVRKPR